MNRRAFLTSLGKLGVFTILPGAGRVWRAERRIQRIEIHQDAYTIFVDDPDGFVSTADIKEILRLLQSFNEPLPPRPLLPFPQLPPI